ncbi:MAG TPA: nitrilase-related carbon-nitrogen hydrolase [Streptosporangiaceae bacterium]|nr:nitrilase-related carbon-nitrogen hydrolase [Streptosporangiaceae bacterium]
MEIDAPDVTVVACCQVAPALGDRASNRELAADAVSRAAAQGAAVVVLPELVSSGYVFESRARSCCAPRATGRRSPGRTVSGRPRSCGSRPRS